MINVVIDMNAVGTNIGMITFVDCDRVDILLGFDLVLSGVLQFSIVEEPLKEE